MDTSTANPSLIRAFNSLQIIGAVAFGLIVISAFIVQRRTRSRHATWFSFCFSWIIFCISFALLFVTGQQDNPSHVLCVAQSALVYAAPPLAGSATLGVVTHLLLNILGALSTSPIKKKFSTVAALLAIMPWILWIIVFVVILTSGIQHPNLVQLSHNGTYCFLVASDITQLTPIWSACVSAMLIVEEGIVIYLLYRNREIISGFAKSVTMAVRVGIFTVTGSVAIAVGLLYSLTSQQRGGQYDVLISAIPISTAIIFGTQRDLLHVWLFWKPHDTQEETPAATPGASIAFSTVLSGMSIPSTIHATARAHHQLHQEEPLLGDV